MSQLTQMKNKLMGRTGHISFKQWIQTMGTFILGDVKRNPCCGMFTGNPQSHGISMYPWYTHVPVEDWPMRVGRITRLASSSWFSPIDWPRLSYCVWVASWPTRWQSNCFFAMWLFTFHLHEIFIALIPFLSHWIGFTNPKHGGQDDEATPSMMWLKILSLGSEHQEAIVFSWCFF